MTARYRRAGSDGAAASCSTSAPTPDDMLCPCIALRRINAIWPAWRNPILWWSAMQGWQRENCSD